MFEKILLYLVYNVFWKEQDDSPFILDVTDVPQGLGRILYDGTSRPHKLTRFWILENLEAVNVVLERNLLSQNDTLSLVGFSFDGFIKDQRLIL